VGARPCLLQRLTLTRPRSGCTAHGLKQAPWTAAFVLRSSIWLREGPPVNDLTPMAQFRRRRCGCISFSRRPALRVAGEIEAGGVPN
jgi:hypothetical protein